jgi:sugar lactone lactonase YvrE
LFAGCGGSSSLNQGSQTNTAVTAEIKGRLLGGQQPLQGAAIQLYAAGSTGYGSGATALTPVVYTDSKGNFSMTDDYTCPSGSALTYLVANGGDPGLGTNNSAITMMAALGSCSNLNSLTYVVIDEVTTVASVWALAPFLGPGAQVGTSSTNAQGLVNAFANVTNLVNLSSGTAPGTTAPQGAVIPVSKINSLANIVAACVNSSSSGACSALFTAATPSSGSAPSNTLDAALNIARNPATNVASLFAIPTPTSPFQPSLSTAPPDWTLAESFGGGGLDYPGSIAVDASGNVWTANYFSSVTELSNTGQPLSPAGGFIGGDLNQSYGLALDIYGNAWVTDEDNTSVNGGNGSVTVFDSSGTVTSGAGGFYGGGVYFPVGIATDTDGSVWIANYGNSTASRLNSEGSPISGSGGFGVNQLAGPVAVAIDASHNAWFANQSADSGSVTSISPNGSIVTSTASGGERTSGIATDSVGTSGNVAGHVWTANFGSSSVSELALNSTGAVVSISTFAARGGLNYPNGIAVDGAGNVWLANYYSAPETTGATITELGGANSANPGVALSPTGGFGEDASLLHPYGIAIDASGNIWVSNFGSSTIAEFLGAAIPVKMPLIGPAQLP